MAADVAILKAFSHAIHEEVLGRDGVDLDLAATVLPRHLYCVIGNLGLDHHAHRVHDGLNLNGLLKLDDFNFGIVFN